MEIEQTQPKFKTSDGREFDTKKAAERHAALLSAQNAYRDAKQAFVRLVAESQLTADGCEFHFGGFATYYWIRPGLSGLPSLQTVYVSPWDCTIDERDNACLIERRDEKGGLFREHRWDVKELYRHQRNAERALLLAQEEWLAERAEEVAALRARVSPEEQG